MIKSITLIFCKAAKLNPESINLTLGTIFVGPNNSGKSKILTEINHRGTHGTIHHDGVILDEIKFEGLSEDDVNLKIEELTIEPNQTENVPPNNMVVRKKKIPEFTFPSKIRFKLYGLLISILIILSNAFFLITH